LDKLGVYETSGDTVMELQIEFASRKPGSFGTSAIGRIMEWITKTWLRFTCTFFSAVITIGVLFSNMTLFRQAAAHNFHSARGNLLLVHILIFAAHLPLSGALRPYLSTCSGDILLPLFALDHPTAAEGVVTFDIARKITVSW
jgi:hypothetical protein